MYTSERSGGTSEGPSNNIIRYEDVRLTTLQTGSAGSLSSFSTPHPIVLQPS